jgi:hypothetical protein
MITIDACDVESLNIISTKVADDFFCLDQLEFQNTIGVVTIPYYHCAEPRTSIVKGMVFRYEQRYLFGASLEIRSSSNYEIMGDCGIGRYSFEKLQYDPRNSLLHVAAIEGLKIVIAIEKLMVRCVVTDTIVGSFWERSLLGLFTFGPFNWNTNAICEE